jgi:hypothetical protein
MDPGHTTINVTAAVDDQGLYSTGGVAAGAPRIDNKFLSLHKKMKLD